MQFNTTTDHFAIGKEYLEIYSLNKIIEEKKMEPIFTHQGMK